MNYQWTQADIVQKRTRPLSYLIFCLSISVLARLSCMVNLDFISVKRQKFASSVEGSRRS